MTHSAAPSLPTETEISAMACVLSRRYGARAVQVARHFILEHEALGDHVRASLWSDVSAFLDRKPPRQPFLKRAAGNLSAF